MPDEFEVQQVLARYVRAADARDGQAIAKLFNYAVCFEIGRAHV